MQISIIPQYNFKLMKNLFLLLAFLGFSFSSFSQSFQSDCSDAILLCSNDLISISSFQGVGKVAGEVGQNNCTGLPFPEENGIWLKWQVVEAGELAFVINPVNPDDDIDFVIFEMENGLTSCDEKRAIRCVASGANLGGHSASYQACTGATGLRASEPDFAEVRGCITDDNNFARSIHANQGDYFALYINNYGSANGVTLEFTGDAQLGSDLVNEIKVQQQESVNGKATFVLQNDPAIQEVANSTYEWYFGPDAIPSSATGFGPHEVQFTSAGEHTIEEVIHTAYGCSFSFSKNVSVSSSTTNTNSPVYIGAETLVGEIYPNPVIRESQIEITSPKDQIALVTISNQLGQTLQRYEVELTSGKQYLQLDLQSLKTDRSLWVSLEIDGKVYARKAVKVVERP